MVLREHALVVDIKTGVHPPPPPEANWQLAALAAMVSGARPVASVTGALAILDKEGAWTFQAKTWSLDELAAITVRMQSAVATWTVVAAQDEAGWGAEPSPGSHCAWCPAVCPMNETQVEAA